MRRRGLYTGSMNTTFPSPKSIPKYLATMLLFYFAARARLPEMPFGFAAGLYAGLVYSRGYVWLLAPMYIAGCLLADCSIGGIVYAALPVLVLTTVRLVYDKLARPLKAWEAQLYHAAVIAVVAVVQAILVHPVWSAVTAALSIAFAYFATIVCYGVLVRGVRHRLSADEKVGGIVLLAILGWGLYRMQWGGFRPYWIVLAAAIVYGVLHMPRGRRDFVVVRRSARRRDCDKRFIRCRRRGCDLFDRRAVCPSAQRRHVVDIGGDPVGGRVGRHLFRVFRRV